MKWNKANKISVDFIMHTLAVLLFAVSVAAGKLKYTTLITQRITY